MFRRLDSNHAARSACTKLEAAGSWAKKYFLASRALMEFVLRPYDLGNTQWYVLYLLASEGPMNQRDLTRKLEVERATLSAVIRSWASSTIQTSATAFGLALTGVMDGRVVNIADVAPVTVYEIAQIVGAIYESSADQLTNPWMGHVDVTLARSLGFQPKIDDQQRRPRRDRRLIAPEQRCQPEPVRSAQIRGFPNLRIVVDSVIPPVPNEQRSV
jgi:hypothetical protein